MNRKHDMPFGATVLPDGGVRFRLWAPGAHKVELCIAEKYFPMKAAGDSPRLGSKTEWEASFQSKR